MSENPLQLLFQAFSVVSETIQSHLSQLITRSSQTQNLTNPLTPKQTTLLSPPTTGAAAYAIRPAHAVVEKPSGPITKEELGRATWIFLHTLAAQYPDNPTRQQKRDVKELMAILSRMYPCKDCADHFKDVLRVNPVQAASHEEFSQWMCHIHNVVNRSLGKVVFPCERVDARWGKLECENRACDLQGTSMSLGLGSDKTIE